MMNPETNGLRIPRKLVESAIDEAIVAAKRSGKTHFVRVMNWDDVYASVGFTDDPKLEVGKLYATVTAEVVTKHYE